MNKQGEHNCGSNLRFDGEEDTRWFAKTTDASMTANRTDEGL